MDLALIQERVKSVKILPTFPLIVNEVMKALNDPNSSAKDLAEKMDASMTGEVLRLANSAYYGTRSFRTIKSLEHAVAIIGFQNISSLILHMPLLSLIRSAKREFGETEYLFHSALTAVLSKEIGKVLNVGDWNILYVCGMMHDVGKILIYSLFSEDWNEILRLRNEKGLRSYEAEQEVIGVDHGYIGAILLDFWNIPETIVNIVRFHHRPESAEPYTEGAMCVNLADFLSIHLKDLLIGGEDELLKETIRKTILYGDEFKGVREKIKEEATEEIFSALIETRSFIRGLGNDKGACC